MNAFHPDKSGSLVDSTLDAAEQKATMFLFAGVIGAFNNPSSHDELCRRLVAGTDSTAIAVDCRPAPEHPHPATANDAYAAMQHVAKKAGCSE